MPTLVHLSDIHFGPPEVPAHVAAVERRLRARTYDVVAISGDLTQRAFAEQFAKARAFVELCRSVAPTVVIPGNHDVRWWMCIGGFGLPSWMHAGFRSAISRDLEPVLSADGITVASLNSSRGIQWTTLTTRLKDLSVVGHVTRRQLARATASLAAAPSGALRVAMLHHNVLKGNLSNRWGLTSRARGLDDFAATGAELVLCGHDHEGQVVQIERGGRRYVVSQVNTISNRARGGRPAAFHEIDWTADAITVRAQSWDATAGDFAESGRWTFDR